LDNLIIECSNVRMVEVHTNIESWVVWLTELEKTECARLAKLMNKLQSSGHWSGGRSCYNYNDRTELL
jgi:hypothetical protein